MDEVKRGRCEVREDLTCENGWRRTARQAAGGRRRLGFHSIRRVSAGTIYQTPDAYRCLGCPNHHPCGGPAVLGSEAAEASGEAGPPWVLQRATDPSHRRGLLAVPGVWFDSVLASKRDFF